MKIFKLMTVALAVGAMASCSDDLGLESQNLKANKGGLSATIDSPVDRMATRLAVNQTGGVQGGTKTVVFSNDEKLRVFTLNQLQQDLYQIEEGQGGSSTADFNQVVNNNLSGQLYAVTEASSVYGISAYQDDAEAKPLLTLTLPGSYTSEFDNAGLKKFPIPFWGPATVSGGNEFSTNKTLSTKLTGLTAILRVSADKLPVGTKAIVLTTHGRRDLMQYEGGANKEGFQIVTPEDKNQIGGFNDLNSWWENNVPYTEGGKSEPISGTLNCILDKDNIEDTYLKVDQVENGQGMTWNTGEGAGATEGTQYASRLVTSDTLRVNLPITITSSMQANQVFYIPIVVGHYDNLRVLAVTGDSKYTYRWIGYEMYNFVDQTFERNKPYYLDLNVIELGHAAISKVNWAIQQFNQTAGRTTLIDVDLLSKNGSGMPNQPTNYIAIQGAGDVILNFDEIAELPDNIATTRENPLIIKNRQNNSYDNASGNAAHQVEIYVPGFWNREEQGEATNYMKVLLGDANVILGTSYCYSESQIINDEQRISGGTWNSENTVVEVLASNTQYVSGHSFNRNKLDIYDDKNAALIVKNGFKEIDFLPNNTGDIYIYTGDSNMEETEINDLLNIQTTHDINIRMTDALVKKMKFEKESIRPRYVYTTGSSAIGALLDGRGFEYKDKNLDKFETVNLADAIATQAFGVDAVDAGVTMVTDNTNDKAPSQVVLESYWTGKALSYTAIEKGYDVSHIYTVAQLASVGEGWSPVSKFNPYTEQTITFGEENIAPYTAHYVIPKDVVNFFWLGDNYTDSKGRSWRWIGAEATVDGFTLNGEWTRLVNMWLLTELVGDKYWSDDPHICCTSCINLPAAQMPNIQITENLGLIRSIINTDTAAVEWINLNDVMYDNDLTNINNVGSIAGYVESPKVDFNHNYVGEVKLNASTLNLGGLVGKIAAETSLKMYNNEVAGHNNWSGLITSTKNYVGGHVGYIEAGTTEYNNNRTDVHVIYGKSDYVGGQVGQFNVTGDIVADGNITVVTENITADGNYAAGHFGQLNAYNNQRTEGEEVNVQANGNKTWVKESIIAGGHFAGGHMGELIANGNVVQNGNDIRVDDVIEAGGAYAGGLNGKIEDQATYTANDNSVRAGYIQANGIDGEQTGSYSGGLCGRIWSKNQIDLLRDKVTANGISGADKFVGGFAGKIYEDEDGAGVLTEDGEVTIAEYIKGSANVAGMFGFSDIFIGTNPFYVNSAKVTSPLIHADFGYAGGIHGYALTGQFHIGYYDPHGAYEPKRDYVVNIQVGKMEGAYAVGGAVGVNHATSGLATIYVNDGPSTTKKPNNLPYYTQVIINVQEWANTQTENYFGTNDAPKHFGGTFGNILGMMHGDLYVDEQINQTQSDLKEILTLPSGNKMGYLVVHDNLLPEVKKAVLYMIHTDQYHNLGTQQFYWGDGNGYIGWNATQQYYIDNVMQIGEQLDMGPQRWGHNIYLKLSQDGSQDAGYKEGYMGARTKLQADNWDSVTF